MQTLATDRLVIAGVELRSRLCLGAGRHADDETMLAALKASGCELVTAPLRRLDLDDPNKRTLLDVIDWKQYRILPNTAGCRTADEAIRIARLARSMGLSDWVRSEEHTSELQSHLNLVCRLLLEKKKARDAISEPPAVRTW